MRKLRYNKISSRFSSGLCDPKNGLKGAKNGKIKWSAIWNTQIIQLKMKNSTGNYFATEAEMLFERPFSICYYVFLQLRILFGPLLVFQVQK